MSRIGVIVLNPAAGGARSCRARSTFDRLLLQWEQECGAESDIRWEICETAGRGHASELAGAAAANGASVVAAAGGDGTLNEVLNGLAGTRAQLALLPFGTGNDFARTVGLYKDLPLAVRTLFAGTPRLIDVGTVAGKRFLNVAGCGFDALVADRANRGLKGLGGMPAYLAAIVMTLAEFRPAEFCLSIDGVRRDLRAMLCSVANARTYGGGMLIAPDARLDDGLFDVCLLSEAGRLEFLRALPRVFSGSHGTHPKVSMLRARHVRIETSPPVPILMDGEVVGLTPAEFAILPAEIEFLFPPDSRQA